MKNSIRVLIIFGILVFSFSSCDIFFGTNSNDGNLNSVTVTIDESGGVFFLSDGQGTPLVTLNVPENAVDSTTSITISKLDENRIASIVENEDSRILLGGFTGEPDGLVFTQPVSVVIDLNNSIELTGLPFHTIVESLDESFEYVPAQLAYDFEDSTISFEIEGFSTHSIVDVNPQNEINTILLNTDDLSEGDINGIEIFMESWFYSIMGKIGHANTWVTIKEGINDFLAWITALEQLVDLNESLKMDALESLGRASIVLEISAEIDYQLEQLDNSSSNYVYEILLDIQRSIDLLSWDELQSLIILNEDLALACGTIELIPSSIDIVVGETNTATVKIKDAADQLFEANNYSDSFSWYSSAFSVTELIPNGVTTSVVGVAEGTAIVTVELDFLVASTKTLTKNATCTVTVGPAEQEESLLVTGFYPEAGSVDVAPSTTILVEFSESMDDVLTKDSFSIVPSTGGALDWQDTEMTMLRFTPSSNLEENTTYNVYIGESAANWDLSKNIESGSVFIFTTGELPPEDTTPPVINTEFSQTFCSVGEQTPDMVSVSVLTATDDITASSSLIYKVFRSSENTISTIENIENGNGILLFSGIGDEFDTYIDNEFIPAPSIGHLDSGLLYETTYYYTVTVSDEAGNVSLYESTSVVTGGEYDMWAVIELLTDYPASTEGSIEEVKTGAYKYYSTWEDGVLTEAINNYALFQEAGTEDYFLEWHVGYHIRTSHVHRSLDENDEIDYHLSWMYSGPPGDFSGSWTESEYTVYEDGYEELVERVATFTPPEDADSRAYEVRIDKYVNGVFLEYRTDIVWDNWITWAQTSSGWVALDLHEYIYDYY